MKINGSLVFDASTASEIQNLRLQKVTALPGIQASDVGRLVYNTNTNVIHVGTNVSGTLSWVPLSTGGDAAALLSEVDRIETALGLNTDGSFNAALFTGNLAGQTSYVELITALQGQAAAASAAAAAEATRATAAEGVLTTNLAAEETARIAGDATNATAITAETTRATAAEGTLTTNLATEVTTRTTADTALGVRIDGVTAAATAETTRIDTALTAETTARVAGDAALQTSLTTEETARIAGDATNAAAISTETTRATTAEGLLDGRITTEVADRTAAVAIVSTGLATEITDRQTAITTVTTALGNEITRATAQEAAIRGELASAVAGLTWEAPVDRIVTNHLAETGLVVGDRIVNMTNNTIFTVTAADQAATDPDGIAASGDETAAVAAVFGAGEVLVDGAAFFNSTNDIGYTFNGTAIVPFSGASSFVAGAGLSMTGNTVNVGNVDGSITITADEISVSAAVRSEITSNAAAITAETTRATTAEAGLGQRVTDEEAARIAAVTAEATTRAAADAALQAEIDAEEVARAAAITAEAAARTAGDATNATAIADEAARATAAELALGVRVDNAGTALTSAIAQEVADRNAAIAVEAAARAAADAAEVTARDAAIAAEAAARTAADTAATARVNSMYFLYESVGGNTTHTVTHSIGQKYCNVTVVDATDNVVIPESIQFTDANSLVVTFNSAIACKVVVMGLAPAV